MRELNKLHINRLTMNSGYIFVEDIDRAKSLKKVFDDMKIEYVTFVIKGRYFHIFGFKPYRIKRRFFEVCKAIGEVVE